MHAPLTTPQLTVLAPSVFATQPWDKVSNKYAFLPTIDVVNALATKGIQPYVARQSRTRIEGKEPYTKHMLRFRTPQVVNKVGDVLPEIVLTNSHDLGSSFHIELGLWRLVCSNGMVTSAGQFESYRIIHIKSTIEDVLQAVDRITQQFPRLLETVDKFKAKELDAVQRQNLAAMALGLRFDKDKFPFDPSRLLTTRRYEDQGTDLWKTYQVIQENLIRGQHGRHRGYWNYPIKSTRAIKSIDTDMTLNKGLWELATAQL